MVETTWGMAERRQTMAEAAGDLGAQGLDLRGLRCPLPALRTEKALRGLARGSRLAVLSDDPLADVDVPHLCRGGGHPLLSSTAVGDHRRFLIEKGGPADDL